MVSDVTFSQTLQQQENTTNTQQQLANDFDQRVQRLRAEQDEKVVALNRAQDNARTTFFNDVAAIISTILRERGAVVVIERRDVFLSHDSIDITSEAILRVNEAKSGSE